MATRYVFVAVETVVSLGEDRIFLRGGEPWDADDPIVKAHPDMFAPHPYRVRSSSAPTGLAPLERAVTDVNERRGRRA